MTLLDAMRDPALFAAWFTPEESWRAWFACLAALFGLPMTPEQAALYRFHTGRPTLPTTRADEAYWIIGRRGGKSLLAALVAVWVACCVDHSARLAPGERGTVMLIASDRRQARTLYRYVLAFLTRVPMFAALIDRQTDDSIDLANGITLEIHTASFKAVRGYAVVAVILDELAFLDDEDAALSDVELVRALRPALLGKRGRPGTRGLLLGISSPHARRGHLWQVAQSWGAEDAPMVWNASTLAMNPAADPDEIARAFATDPHAALAEYGRDGRVEFRGDLEGYLSREQLAGVVIPGRSGLPYDGESTYYMFVDPATGSAGASGDSMTAAIGHVDTYTEDDEHVVVVDQVLEARAPFDPVEVARAVAEVAKGYRVSTVYGDRFAMGWTGSAFAEAGVRYEASPWSRSELYLTLLSLVNAKRVELPEHPRLLAQLCALERRVGAGRENIDHPARTGAHDDVANSVAGAVALAWEAAMRPAVRCW